MEDTATPTPAAALREFPQTEVGALASLIPDTPWTTTAVQCCERRIARAWVDSEDAPTEVAIVLPGDPDAGTPPTAYLFGSEGAPDALVAWVSAVEGPLDVICDDEVGAHVAAAHPEAEATELVAHWFEHLDAVERPDNGVRRLRLRDEPALARLGAEGVLRSFETMKDLLMVGGASGLVHEERVIAAAFTVDQSVNYARILAHTAEEVRGRGLANAACRHLVASHHEQGRLACALVPREDKEAAGLAQSLGFQGAARLTRYRLGG